MIVRELLTRLGFEVDDAKINAWNERIEQGKKSTVEFGKKVVETTGKIAAMGAAMAAVAAAGVLKLTSDLAKEAIELDNVAKKIGVTAEELQRLEFAGKRTGAEVDNTREAVKTLRENLGEMQRLGSGPAVDALKSLGLELGEILDLPAQEQFELLAESLSGLENDSQRLSVAIELMGEDGAALLPLFKQGAQGIRELSDEAERYGLVTDEQIKRARKLGAVQARVEQQFASVRREIGSELLPIVSEYLELAADWIDNNREILRQRLQEWIRGLTDAGRQLLPVIEKAVELLAEFVEASGGADEALETVAAGFVGVKIAATGAFGPISLITGAFVAILPHAIKLGEALGDILFEFSEIGKLAKIVQNPIVRSAVAIAPGGATLLPLLDELAKTADLNEEAKRADDRLGGRTTQRGLLSPEEVARQKAEEEAAAASRATERSFAERQAAGARVRQKLGKGAKADELVDKVIRGVLSESQALARASGRGKVPTAGGGGGAAQEKSLSPEERAKLSDDELAKLLRAEAAEKTAREAQTERESRLQRRLGLAAPLTFADALAASLSPTPGIGTPSGLDRAGGGSRPGLGTTINRFDNTYNAPTTINVDLPPETMQGRSDEDLGRAIAEGIADELERRNRRAYDHFRAATGG